MIDSQIDYIRTALSMMDDPALANFRWNCETLYCVEEFLKTATPEEEQKLFALFATGKMGLSANYRNFTDLADTAVLRTRLGEWAKRLAAQASPSKPQCVPTSTASQWGSAC